MSSKIIIITLLSFALVQLNSVSAQQQILQPSQQPQTQQQQQQQIGNPDSQTISFGEQAKNYLLPMVNVDRHDNKSKVEVHVPLFFNMLNDKDESTGKSKLDLSVMSGLVTVNKDRERDENGNLTGPLVVTVFGIPVYSGYSSSKPQRGGTASNLSDSMRDLGNSVSSKGQEYLKQISETVRQTNERSLSSLAETFSRIAGSLNNAGLGIKKNTELESIQKPLDQRANSIDVTG